MKHIVIGISGWTYAPWRGSFYPKGLKQKDELAFAASKLPSIEVNGTFYSMLRPANYQTWYEQTPADFVFSLKGPKYLTHVRRLKEFATPLSNFLASGVLGLREKLGPILWQFPPNLAFDAERFGAFMAALPHDTQAAAVLAQGHSDWMAGRTCLETDRARPLLHAFEVRHASFKNPEFVALARRHNVAIVVGDTAGRWPYIEDVTSNFVYVRLHGDETVYPHGYTKTALNHWAKRLTAWSEGQQPANAELLLEAAPSVEHRNVFAYFDNDTKETAPFDALSMISRLEQPESSTDAKPKRSKKVAGAA